ncbi:MAG: AAA family ATPase [Mollicutes bacterium]|nr:AAA family ATPase [Mollicutes bacterium]
MEFNQNNIDFKAALDFLQKYAGHEYRKPGTPGHTPQENAIFQDILTKGRDAINQFKKMAEVCKEKFGLILKGQIRWDDASHVKVRSYIWAELIFPNCQNCPVSISVFANCASNKMTRYRFTLEIRNEQAKKMPNILKDYYLFLDDDLPSNSKLVYACGSDENGAPTVLNEPREAIKANIESGKYDKVQLCQIVDNQVKTTNDDFYHAMVDGIGELIPYYKKILEKAGILTPECESTNCLPKTKPSNPPFPKNLIFYGAPGTGKTYKTVNQAVAICLKKSLSEINAMPREELTKTYRDLMERGNISFVTFHQSYSYEDFVIGIFPELSSGKDNQSNGIRYVRKDGIFKVLCDTARNHKDANFVLIIDEINRGNISKIFGELITLIEDSKREGEKEETSVLLPYLDNENIIRFSVPSNVYIIGTMNTADRSIQHVDTALRRRFVFEEMLPNSGLFKDIEINMADKSLNVATLLDSINRRIKRYFDREHVIGHAYFMPLKQEGLSEEEKLRILGDIFHDRIIPLLQDYFFEDYSKIQKVLGESEDTQDDESLIRKAQEDIVDDEDDGRDVYEVAPKGDSVYTNIDTYLLMAK